MTRFGNVFPYPRSVPNPSGGAAEYDATAMKVVGDLGAFIWEKVTGEKPEDYDAGSNRLSNMEHMLKAEAAAVLDDAPSFDGSMRNPFACHVLNSPVTACKNKEQMKKEKGFAWEEEQCVVWEKMYGASCI